jgi:putative ABC transport system permease protein
VLHTLGLTALGTAFGVVVAWTLAHAIAALLFGVAPTDLATFSGMVVVLAAVAAAAAYVPARGVLRIDPAIALRVE